MVRRLYPRGFECSQDAPEAETQGVRTKSALSALLQHLSEDRFPGIAGHFRRQAHQARPLLLATAGGEPSDAAAVRCHGAADLRVAAASGVGGTGWKQENRPTRRVETERCLSNGRERRDSAVLGPSGRARTPPSEGESDAREEGLHPEGSKAGNWVYAGLESGAEKGNPGFIRVLPFPVISSILQPGTGRLGPSNVTS